MSKGIAIDGEIKPEHKKILTLPALNFLEKLVRQFKKDRDLLLNHRQQRRERIRSGTEKMGFQNDTQNIRNSEWHIAKLPEIAWEEGVEITGPVGDRKMALKRYNSGASWTMEDFEDSQSPTWENVMNGHINLYDAARHSLWFDHPRDGIVSMVDQPAHLTVRPRGWHLDEHHVTLNNEPIPAALFDYGLHIYHNTLLANRDRGIFFYLPKLEGAAGAKLWNDIFVWTEQEFGLPRGTIKATVLIEHVLALFEADEILWTLRDHSAGLNVGRWDYIASLERMLINESFPGRGKITMSTDCMNAYVDYVGYVCYKRNAPFIGGMEAQIPVKNDPELNRRALEKAQAGKEVEAYAKGCLRAWVAHPAMVEPIGKIFTNRENEWMENARLGYGILKRNIYDRPYLNIPEGNVNEDDLREGVAACIKYIGNWIDGYGAVAIDYRDKDGSLLKLLMDDAATAEISRTQIWKWLRLGTCLESGHPITLKLVSEFVHKELGSITEQIRNKEIPIRNYGLAAILFMTLVTTDEDNFPEYLTTHLMNTLLSSE